MTMATAASDSDGGGRRWRRNDGSSAVGGVATCGDGDKVGVEPTTW